MAYTVDYTVRVGSNHDLDNERIDDLPISCIDHGAFPSNWHTLPYKLTTVFALILPFLWEMPALYPCHTPHPPGLMLEYPPPYNKEVVSRGTSAPLIWAKS